MPPSNEASLPRTSDGLVDLQYGVAGVLGIGLQHVGEVLALTFGEEQTHKAIHALAVDGCGHGSEAQRALFDRVGWRVYLDEHADLINDMIELTGPWRDGAAYAAQGIAPREPVDRPASRDDRKQRIDALVAYGTTMLAHGATLFGDSYLNVWKGVAARAAIDFGGTISLEGLQLLSGVTLGAVRNAVSIGELQPDEAGNVAADTAKPWLIRRRDFCPSRWENPNDGQELLDLGKIDEPDAAGMIFVPQDSDGKPFTPEHVVRPAKSVPGLSITVGAKGSEEQHRDFYEALVALAKMDVPRWRRRNDQGNWGIVRARGAWVAVSKAEIDRQLTTKSVGAA